MISAISFLPTSGWLVFYLIPMLLQWFFSDVYMYEAQVWIGIVFFCDAFFIRCDKLQIVIWSG